MQRRPNTQFIENIAALTTPEELKSRRVALETAMEGEYLLMLTYALFKRPLPEQAMRPSQQIFKDDQPLIEQVMIVTFLQQLLNPETSEVLVENKTYELSEQAFPAFLDPSLEESMLSRAKSEAKKHESNLAAQAVASPDPRTFSIASAQEEEIESAAEESESESDSSKGYSASEERAPLISSPRRLPFSPSRSPLKIVGDAFYGRGDYPEAAKTVCAIESQRKFLKALPVHLSALLRRVTDRLINERYPAENPSNSSPFNAARSLFAEDKSPIKLLRNFSQLLILLMTDAMVQLNELLSNSQNQHFLTPEGLAHVFTQPQDQQHLNKLIENIQGIAKEVDYSNYSPLKEDIAPLFTAKDVIHFIGALATKDTLIPKRGRNDRGMSVSSQAGANEVIPARPPRVLPASETSELLRPELSVAEYPLPAYLAKSLMHHLANEIEAAANKMQGGLISLSGTQQKVDDMKVAAKQLRAEAPRATLREIYAIEVNGEMLQTILTRKRGGGNSSSTEEASSFASTLIKAGLAFLAENPASLLRRYVFLTQLKAATDFKVNPRKQNEQDYAAHLNNTILGMHVLRQEMAVLYPTNNQPLNANTIIKQIKALMDLAKKHADITTLLRVLSVAYLDKLDERAISDLPLSSKQWLFFNDYSTQHAPTNKEAFIKAVAAKICDKEAKVRALGIRPWVVALLEITASHPGRYVEEGFYAQFLGGKPYTHQEHQKKIQPAFLHLGACLDNYFPKLIRAEENSASILSIFSPAETITARSYYIAGANKKVHKTFLRLTTNLQAYWQAALAWGLKTDAITATTLAIVNSRDEEALKEWDTALAVAAESTSSAELQVNAWIIHSILHEQAKEHGIAAFTTIDKKWSGSFEKRLACYQTMLAFANIFFNHVKREQININEANQNLVKLGDAIHHYLQFLSATIDAETVPLSALAQQQSNKARMKLEGQIVTLNILATAYGISEATPLLNLQESIQKFNHDFAKFCYLPTNNDSVNIKNLRTQIYGENVSNPNAGPAFDHALERAVQAGNEAFFINAICNETHHPLLDDRVRWVCQKIATAYPANEHVNLMWQKLGESFYGNSSALSDLFNHYLLQENIELALKIAIFGFNNKKFAQDKWIFGQQILIAFSKFVKAEDYNSENFFARGDIKKLYIALHNLATTSHFVSDKERTAIEDLKKTISVAPDQNMQDEYEALDLESKRQAIVYSASEKTLLGLSMASQAQQDNGIKHVRFASFSEPSSNKPNTPTPVAKKRSPEEIQQEFDALITELVDGAYPHEDMQYYLKEKKQVPKNELTRAQLKEMLRASIKTSKGNSIKIDSKILKEALDDVSQKMYTKSTVPKYQQSPEIPKVRIVTMKSNTHNFGGKTLPQLATEYGPRLQNLLNEANSSLLDKPEEAPQIETPSPAAVTSAPVHSSSSVVAHYPREQAIQQATIRAVTWLLSGEPTPENIPKEIKEVLDVASITPELISEYEEKLKALRIGNDFRHRIRLIAAKKYEECLKHIFTYFKPEGEIPPKERNPFGQEDAELWQFIRDLEAHIKTLASNFPTEVAKYQQYLENFVWAIAEKGALEQQDGPENPKKHAYLAVLAKLDFDWDYLIALGVKQYAAMNPATRSIKGPSMTRALAELALPLVNFPDYQKASGLEEDAKSWQGVIAKCRSSSILDNVETLYYNIYTLAQACILPLIARPFVDDENEDNELHEVQDKANILLSWLQYQVATDQKFLDWHAEILDIAKGYPSFLHALVYPQPSAVDQRRILTEGSVYKDTITVKKNIKARPYAWAKAYMGQSNYPVQFVYEAYAAYAIERILRNQEIKKDEYEIHWKGKKEKRYATALEQLCLAFMVTKCFYGSLDADQEKKVRLFERALTLVAARGYLEHSLQKEEATQKIIDELLIRACDSLHKMMAPDFEEEVNDPEKRVLQENSMDWIVSTPEILQKYLERASINGIQSEKQVNFIFKLLAKSKEAPFEDLKSVPGETNTAPLGTPPRANNNSDRNNAVIETPLVEMAKTYDEKEMAVLKDSKKPLGTVLKVPYSERSMIESADTHKHQALFVKACNYMYQYIDEGRPAPTARLGALFNTVEARLNKFIEKIRENKLWQEYYAYLADNNRQLPTFANANAAKSESYAQLHLNTLINALLDHDCEDPRVKSNLIMYIKTRHAEVLRTKVADQMTKELQGRKGEAIATLLAKRDHEAIKFQQLWREMLPEKVKSSVTPASSIGARGTGVMFKEASTASRANSVVDADGLCLNL